MTGFCLPQPIPTTTKTNAMVKNVAEREISPHYAALIKIAGRWRRQKDDAATFNFGFGSFMIEEINTRISIYGKSARRRKRREGTRMRSRITPSSPRGSNDPPSRRFVLAVPERADQPLRSSFD
jgi:hypothetical protein